MTMNGNQSQIGQLECTEVRGIKAPVVIQCQRDFWVEVSGRPYPEAVEALVSRNMLVAATEFEVVLSRRSNGQSEECQ